MQKNSRLIQLTYSNAMWECLWIIDGNKACFGRGKTPIDAVKLCQVDKIFSEQEDYNVLSQKQI